MSTTRTPGKTPLRRYAAAAMVVGCLSLLTGCLSPSQASVQNALNADRTHYGLRSLPTEVDAQVKAQKWAEKLAAEQTLYHSTLSDGIHVRWCSIGENVGFGPSVKDVENAYMNSPHHRANILDPKWNGVGVGYAKNNGLVYTVQVFLKTC